MDIARSQTRLKQCLVTLLLSICVALPACAVTPVDLPQAAGAAAAQNGTVQASGTEQRVVAVGDVHGDFTQLKSLLESIGIIDAQLNWAAGTTHLVQLGDLPDRGPDSRAAMDFLIELEAQARQAGGAVTVLIGNHEAMMMTGDLRYVHPGEYAAFVDRGSKKKQRAYYRQTVAYLKANLPKSEQPKFDKAHRQAWEAKHPLGYVEHRLAWAPTGEYGKWVLSRPAVAKVGTTLFVHGGLSPTFAEMSVAEINTRVRTALAEGEQVKEDTIIDDAEGPLWYRGWAMLPQIAANQTALEQVLQNHQVQRMVIAHTPRAPAIIPRFAGKVLLADVGLSAYYGGAMAALEIVGNETTLLLADARITIPQNPSQWPAYFSQVAAVIEQADKLQQYVQADAQSTAAAEAAARDETEDANSAKAAANDG